MAALGTRVAVLCGLLTVGLLGGSGVAAASPGVTSSEQQFFEALDGAQILQLGSVYSPKILSAANQACAQRASGRDVTSINASIGQGLRGVGFDWVTDSVAGGIVSIAFTQLCPR